MLPRQLHLPTNPFSLLFIGHFHRNELTMEEERTGEGKDGQTKNPSAFEEASD